MFIWRLSAGARASVPHGAAELRMRRLIWTDAFSASDCSQIHYDARTNTKKVVKALGAMMTHDFGQGDRYGDQLCQGPVKGSAAMAL